MLFNKNMMGIYIYLKMTKYMNEILLKKIKIDVHPKIKDNFPFIFPSLLAVKF